MAVFSLIIIHCTLFISRAAAQAQLEYWFDSDPGRGQATTVAATIDAEGLVQFDAPTDGLTEGNHLMGVRSYHTDAEGHTSFGPTILRYVAVTRPAHEGIAYLEYFWDEDPGVGHATKLPIVAQRELNLDNVEFSTQHLSAGLHELGIRSFGGVGWSPTVRLETYVPMRQADVQVSYAEYFWNEDPGYGQGTPIEIDPAAQVSLESLGIPTTDIHGDALFFIRYYGNNGWSPTLCYNIIVDAEGNFTLNSQAATSLDNRNYQSLPDLVADLADRSVGNDITLNVITTGTDYALDATTPEVLQQLAAISQSIDQVSTYSEGKTIGFKATAGSGNTLSVSTTPEGLPTAINMLAHTWLENVGLTINGTAYDFSAWARAPRYQAEPICPGQTTDELTIGTPAEGLVVAYTAQPHQGCTIVGHQTSVTYEGTLPAMQLLNNGSKTDSLAFLVELKDNEGTTLSSYTYYIYVRASVSDKAFSGMQPADASSLNPGTTTLRWNAIGGAQGYRLTLTDDDTTVLDGSPVTKTTYSLTVEPGHQYTWQVVAIGPCDELSSQTMHFSGRLLPDLAVTAIDQPATAQAGNTVTVTATIANQGQGATTESSWTDRLYYAIDSDDFAQATQAASVAHSGALAADASYEVTFSFKAPQVETGQMYLFVATDAESKVLESNADNNRTTAATATTLQPFYMNASDLAALRRLHADFGGSQWNGTQWDTTSELIRPGNWSGVSFDTEGRVTAISLQGRGLSGSLSEAEAPALPQLKTLNLSRNTLSGNPAAFVTASCMPLIASLNLSYNQIDELSAPLPSTISSLNLGYQHRREGSNSVLPGLDQLATRLLPIGNNMDNVQLSAVAYYNHTAQDFTAHPALNVYSTDLNTRYGTLNWSNTLQAYSYAANSWQQTMEQDTPALLVVESGATQGSVWPAQMHFTLGDANLSGLVDVNDVQRTLNYVINSSSNNTMFGLWAANTFTEGEAEQQTVINIQDIVCTVNIVLSNEGLAATRRLRAPGLNAAEQQQEAAHATFYADGRSLMLQTYDEIGAFDLELQGVNDRQVKLLLNSREWQMLTRNTALGVRLVVFSPTGQTLPAGTTQLLRLGGDATLVAVQATSPDAQEVPASTATATATGIHDAYGSYGSYEPYSPHESYKTYDLQGRQLNNSHQLRKGLYIQNGKKIRR